MERIVTANIQTTVGYPHNSETIEAKTKNMDT